MKNIAVFGSSSIETWDPIWQESFNLGKAIAELKMGVVTGGYYGVMGAVSKGAKLSGGESIGVISSSFTFRDGHNPWLTKVITRDGIVDRIGGLLEISDAVVVMPGNIGTLNELLMLMTLWKVHESSVKAFVIKDPFEKTLNSLVENKILTEIDFLHLEFVENIQEIIEKLKSTFNK